MKLRIELGDVDTLTGGILQRSYYAYALDVKCVGDVSFITYTNDEWQSNLLGIPTFKAALEYAVKTTLYPMVFVEEQKKTSKKRTLESVNFDIHYSCMLIGDGGREITVNGITITNVTAIKSKKHRK